MLILPVLFAIVDFVLAPEESTADIAWIGCERSEIISLHGPYRGFFHWDKSLTRSLLPCRPPNTSHSATLHACDGPEHSFFASQQLDAHAMNLVPRCLGKLNDSSGCQVLCTTRRLQPESISSFRSGHVADSASPTVQSFVFCPKVVLTSWLGLLALSLRPSRSEMNFCTNRVVRSFHFKGSAGLCSAF